MTVTYANEQTVVLLERAAWQLGHDGTLGSDPSDEAIIDGAWKALDTGRSELTSAHEFAVVNAWDRGVRGRPL